MKSFRLERVENIIAQEIGNLILSGKIKDYRVTPMLSVSHVEVSSDLAHAKIWISAMNDQTNLEKALEGLESASGFIQSILGKKLQTRHTPKLLFKKDRSLEEAIRIQNKLREVLPDDSK